MQRTLDFGSISSTVTMLDRHSLFEGLNAELYCIADTNTEKYAPRDFPLIALPAGEASKSWDQLHHILDALLAAGLSRSGTVVGIGGGAVTDVAACAGSLFLRGCRVVLVPTSLLAMVDAAIGGKTGINFGGFKNMVGTFYPAHEVRICTGLLETLSDREYKSGLAEVIKSALLGDRGLLETLETRRDDVLSREPSIVDEVVWACVNVKGDVVEQDLRESGVRAHLNLGHTFGHALESVAGLGAYSHGEAVAWGMAQAMELGLRIGVTEPDYARRVRDLLEAYGYRIDPLPELAREIRLAMNMDKKRVRHEVRFILQRAVEDTLVTAVDETTLEAALSGR
ncbi:MAG: 3-dehydroquinate synthase family protein [Spirochaetales bacterium]